MREVDIRPEKLFNEYLRLSVLDAERFFAASDTRVPRDCPGCNDDRPITAFTKNGFGLVRCQTCDTLYANPAPKPDLLHEFYEDSPSQQFWAGKFFPAVAEVRREKIFKPRVERIQHLLSSNEYEPKRIVDVGAGTGIFLEECRMAGLGRKLAAIEPCLPLTHILQEKGFDTFTGFAETAANDPTWRGQFDLVTSFEVIEHVSSVRQFIGSLSDLVSENGFLLLTGLCGTGFDILTLGKFSNAVSPPHHINFLSRRGVSALLSKCGLKEVAFLTPGKLDVDIVRNALENYTDLDVNPFIRNLIENTADSVQQAFQKFLSDNQLSSHMWIVAQKPG